MTARAAGSAQIVVSYGGTASVAEVQVSDDEEEEEEEEVVRTLHFDEIEPGDVPEGYAGLLWSDFGVTSSDLGGFGNARQSGGQVAYGTLLQAEFLAELPGTAFDFRSAWFTAVSNRPLSPATVNVLGRSIEDLSEFSLSLRQDLTGAGLETVEDVLSLTRVELEARERGRPWFLPRLRPTARARRRCRRSPSRRGRRS